MLKPGRDFHQQQLDERLQDDLTQLVHLAVREDLDRGYDLTTLAVVPPGLPAQAAIVARVAGVSAGIELLPWIVAALDSSIELDSVWTDGKPFEAGQALARISGDSRDVLTCERILLNFLGRLCGIATFTHQHVKQIEDLKTNLYDTRKTTPGWRRLEKYATRCGGARNHRSGLYEAIMVKDNHLACHQRVTGKLLSPSEAIRHVRQFLGESTTEANETIVEIEVDSLQQLEDALSADPDIVLLDNMDVSRLKEAVALRDQLNPQVELEASGGVTMETLRPKAETGVDRISLGALTHSAINLDLGLDWKLGTLS